MAYSGGRFGAVSGQLGSATRNVFIAQREHKRTSFYQVAEPTDKIITRNKNQ